MQVSKKLERTGRKLTAIEAEAVEQVTPGPKTVAAKAVAAIGKLGDQPELRTLSALVFAAGLMTTDRRLCRAGLRMFVAHEIATTLKDVVKTRVDRTRPRAASSHPERKVKLGDSTAKDQTSFPSGHSAGSTAVARAFAREFPGQQGPALAAAAVVAAAQVPRCAHYPTDVAAGIALGAFSEAVADFLFRHSAADTPKPEAEPRPPLRA